MVRKAAHEQVAVGGWLEWLGGIDTTFEEPGLTGVADASAITSKGLGVRPCFKHRRRGPSGCLRDR